MELQIGDKGFAYTNGERSGVVMIVTGEFIRHENGVARKGYWLASKCKVVFNSILADHVADHWISA